MRRRDQVRQIEALRERVRAGSLVVALLLVVTATELAIRFPERGSELFALWVGEALAVAALRPFAGRVRRSRVVALTLVFSTIPAIGLPATLAIEPGTLLLMTSSFAILPVAVPLFLQWSGRTRDWWSGTYAIAMSSILLFVAVGSLGLMTRMDLAAAMWVGCLIGWVGGRLLERSRLGNLEQEVELHRLNRMLRSHATTDPLTGLANRRQLETDLSLLDVSLQRSQLPCAVLMLDLDRFKRLNDELGHAAGDTALRAVALELKRHVRGGDTVYRYGGEEFLVILPDTALELAFQVAERIRAAIAALRIPAGDPSRATLTVSGGVVVADLPYAGWDAILAASDTALYEAKAGGRDRICGPQSSSDSARWPGATSAARA